MAGALRPQDAAEERDARGLAGLREDEPLQLRPRQAGAARERHVRQEGPLVKAKPAGRELPAQAPRQGLERGALLDAQPEGRVATAAKGAEALRRELQRPYAHARRVERVHRTPGVRLPHLAEKRQREVVAPRPDKASLADEREPSRQRGHLVGERLRQLQRDERPHDASSNSPSLSAMMGPS